MTVSTITYLTRLNAISDLQKTFTVTDQGKGSGILNLTLTGEDQSRTTDLLRSISANYLNQNIARQAAQDEKSLEFLNKQLPQVRMELIKQRTNSTHTGNRKTPLI